MRMRPRVRTSATEVRNVTSFYGSSCANNGKDALNTPDIYTLVFIHTEGAALPLQYGVDCELMLASGLKEMLRIQFSRPVKDERAARSALTMMGQVAWEEVRPRPP
eukprot:1186088-Prorocentrum_minimum.AAC.2